MQIITKALVYGSRFKSKTGHNILKFVFMSYVGQCTSQATIYFKVKKNLIRNIVDPMW